MNNLNHRVMGHECLSEANFMLRTSCFVLLRQKGAL